MISGISKTQAAFTAFQSGEYEKALNLYQELSATIGSHAYGINVAICERRLASLTAKSGTQKPLDRYAATACPSTPSVDLETNKSSLSANPPDSASKNREKVNSSIRVAQLELSDQIAWYDVAVQQGDDITVKAAVSYQTIDGTNRRKAVMVVSAFDVHGKEMEFSCGQLAKSRHLQGYFKYINCNLGKVATVHNFKIPVGVDRIKIGLCRFNTTATDRIIVEPLEINVKSRDESRTAFVPPSAQAAEISILGWPDQPDNGRPYVLGIMDEFTTGCFEQEVSLIQPRPDNWYALAEKYPPAFCFIESAWKGNQNSWQYRVADYATKPGQEVSQLAEYANQRKIPTIFWNKEDPVHHQKFMCSAQLVDHIFTTDANMCDSYRKQTGNSNVHALPFAAQPALHKPAPMKGRRPRSCFAGSWYGERHAERGQAMRWLLQAANRFGLDIYDRNHGTGAFPFPQEYQKGIKGSLPYKELCDEYSRYRVFLNVNSVLDSPTMFSRRVFELMASGTPVVSTYARGIEELFHSDAVWLVHSEEEAANAIHTLLTDDVEWRRRSLAGIREVFSRHTYTHRLNFILEKIGLHEQIRKEPNLLLVAKSTNNAELEYLIKTAEQQTYRNYHLIIDTNHSIKLSGTLPSNILVGQTLTQAVLSEHAKSAMAIGWLSGGAVYGANYLRDLVNSTLYEPNADGWAKSIGVDAFSYGTTSLFCASMWQRDVFLSRYLNADALDVVGHEMLYCIDSDEFSIDIRHLQQLHGAEQ